LRIWVWPKSSNITMAKWVAIYQKYIDNKL